MITHLYEFAVYPRCVAAMESDDDELYLLHRRPRPDVCDICLYVRDTVGADPLLEHTQTRIAIGLMFEDLQEAGHPMRMVQLHRRAMPLPGDQHPIEPRHWLWALLIFPSFVIDLQK